MDSTRLWTELRANVFAVPSFDVDGPTLYYETRGTGPSVVLLHGFTSRGTSWTRLGWLDLLAESGFQAIAPDAPSHGRSDRIYEPTLCTTERLTVDVVALLDYLEVPQASLFGFSMGGGIALRAAMDQPARVKAVVVGGVGDSALNQLHDPREISQLVAAFSAPSGDEVAPVRQPVLVIAAADDEYMSRTQALIEWLAPAKTFSVTSTVRKLAISGFLSRPGVQPALARAGPPPIRWRSATLSGTGLTASGSTSHTAAAAALVSART